MFDSFNTSHFITMVGLAMLAPFVCGIVEAYANAKFPQIGSKRKIILPEFFNVFWILWATYFFVRLSYFGIDNTEKISVLVGVVYVFVVVIGIASVAICLNDRITWSDQTINIRQKKISKSYHFANIRYIRSLTSGNVEIGFEDGHSITLRELNYGVRHLWRDICKWLDDCRPVCEIESSALH